MLTVYNQTSGTKETIIAISAHLEYVFKFNNARLILISQVLMLFNITRECNINVPNKEQIIFTN